MWINKTTLLNFFNRKKSRTGVRDFWDRQHFSVFAKQTGHPDRHPMCGSGLTGAFTNQRGRGLDGSPTGTTFTMALLFNDDGTDVIEQRVIVLVLLTKRGFGIGLLSAQN